MNIFVTGASGFIGKEFSIKADQPINRVNIYSTTGQLVISETKSNISIESLNTGLYHVEIVTGQKTTIKKLVKN